MNKVRIQIVLRNVSFLTHKILLTTFFSVLLGPEEFKASEFCPHSVLSSLLNSIFVVSGGESILPFELHHANESFDQVRTLGQDTKNYAE